MIGSVSVNIDKEEEPAKEFTFNTFIPAREHFQEFKQTQIEKAKTNNQIDLEVIK